MGRFKKLFTSIKADYKKIFMLIFAPNIYTFWGFYTHGIAMLVCVYLQKSAAAAENSKNSFW